MAIFFGFFAHRSLKRCVLEGGLDIHSDAKAMSQVECSVTPPHNLWNFGSAQSLGEATPTENSELFHVFLYAGLAGGGVDCTMQIKAPSLSGGRDGLFAVLNGGRSTTAPAIIRAKLTEVLMKEFAEQWVEPGGKGTPPNSLQYLTHTYLAAHQ